MATITPLLRQALMGGMAGPQHFRMPGAPPWLGEATPGMQEFGVGPVAPRSFFPNPEVTPTPDGAAGFHVGDPAAEYLQLDAAEQQLEAARARQAQQAAAALQQTQLLQGQLPGNEGPGLFRNTQGEQQAFAPGQAMFPGTPYELPGFHGNSTERDTSQTSGSRLQRQRRGGANLRRAVGNRRRGIRTKFKGMRNYGEEGGGSLNMFNQAQERASKLRGAMTSARTRGTATGGAEARLANRGR